jgi:hypothetical protein
MYGLRWRTLFAVTVLSLSTALRPPLLPAATRTAGTKSPATGSDYMQALAAADRFLQAWQAGDLETGTAMLTTRAKNKTNHDEFDRFFSASAPAAYEIEHGKFLHRGRYEFPIVLLTTSPKSPRRRSSKIVVLNHGHNDWGIDKLP